MCAKQTQKYELYISSVLLKKSFDNIIVSKIASKLEDLSINWSFLGVKFYLVRKMFASLDVMRHTAVELKHYTLCWTDVPGKKLNLLLH
jgi:hypothetical protein